MLGEGGMGKLWKASSSSSKDVVVKEPKLLGDQDDSIRLEKLKVEAAILKNINHKNIVKYVDSMDLRWTFYLVIEFVPGKTMREVFWKRPANEYEARQYALSVLDALQYLHSMNIIHRDINPKNIILPSDLVIIDFGAAKHGYTQVSPDPFGNTIVGTPGWSAPEQFRGLIAGPSCDIYAVGAVLFFLVTGCAPQQYIRSDLTVESPKKINPSISSELANVVQRAMDPEPTHRYQIAEDMANEMQGFKVAQDSPCVYCKGKKYQIDKTLTIGRQPQCHIFIDDPQCYISRLHAEVFMDGDKCYIEDVGSKNGTFIYRGQWPNGRFQQITKSELADGDLVALCWRQDKGPYITLNFKSGGP
jgi:serine/threonine protein kinase